MLRQSFSFDLKGASHFSVLLWLLIIGCQQSNVGNFPDANGVYHVFPGDDIQKALDAAAQNKTAKRILVHDGTYRPLAPAQALIFFNAIHDGIILEAEGDLSLIHISEPTRPY